MIGAEKVGTSTDHKFKGIATGSAAGHGFEVVRGTGEKAFFFESAIDMLSYLQMHDKELTDCRLVSMMGVKRTSCLKRCSVTIFPLKMYFYAPTTTPQAMNLPSVCRSSTPT